MIEEPNKQVNGRELSSVVEGPKQANDQKLSGMIESSNKQVDDQELSGTEILTYRCLFMYYFGITLLLVVVISVVALVLHLLDITFGYKYNFPFLVFVVLFGALGAFFSVMTRIYYKLEELSVKELQRLEKLGERHLFMYACVPLILGMIGALVLYLAIDAELISGSMFQKFACIPLVRRNMQRLRRISFLCPSS